MLPDLIYDRTEYDVFRKTNKGYYNYTDINRVEKWCNYLAEVLTENSYPISLTTKQNWSKNDFPTLAEINRVRNNINLLKQRYIVYSSTPTIQIKQTLNYADANTFEKILHDIDEIIENTENYFVYSGVSNLNQNRSWQNKYRRNTSWIGIPYNINEFINTDTVEIIATDTEEIITTKTSILELVQIDKRNDVYATLQALNESMQIIDNLIGYEAVYYTLINIIDDPSFEEGLWTGTTISESEKLFGNKSSTLSETTITTMPSITPVLHHKYYGRHYMKTNGLVTIADDRFELYAGDGLGLNFVFGHNSGNYPEWTAESSIQEITVLNASTGFMIRNFVVNASNTLYTDGLMIIDLTEVFEAGHEPTKEWCDENIPFFIGSKTIKVRKEN